MVVGGEWEWKGSGREVGVGVGVEKVNWSCGRRS